MFFFIGQIQILITVLGTLLYVNIQCLHPFLLWLAASFSSAVFTLLLYSHTYSFGSVGEAIGVILLVLQVAGSGGTFSIEILPSEFQMLYKYMPFNYAMNGMRECIGGMYKQDYWKYMSGLLIYIVIVLVIGLVIGIPSRKVNLKIEKNIEKTDLLI